MANKEDRQLEYVKRIESKMESLKTSLINSKKTNDVLRELWHKSVKNEVAVKKHIKRLKAQNDILVECLAEERCLRQQAYQWYKDKLNSKFMWLMDYFFMSWED